MSAVNLIFFHHVTVCRSGMSAVVGCWLLFTPFVSVCIWTLAVARVQEKWVLLPWRNSWEGPLFSTNTMASQKGNDLTVKSRVEQLDALELDREVLHVLKSQLLSVLKFLPLSWQNKWEPEVDTILQIIILHLSLRGVGATFGQQLLNIEFVKSQRKSALLAISIPILLKYIQKRVSSVALRTQSSKVKKIMDFLSHWGETSFAVGSLLNLLLFLRSGHYPNLLYRIFGVQMAYVSSKSRQRQVGYTHMTRELIWHSFIELLVFVLPLINYHYLKRQVLRILMLGASASKSKRGNEKRITFTINSKCAVCSQRPILPHHMDCDHIFCFFCLQANILADPQFSCPQCGQVASGLSSAKRVCLTAMW